MLELLAKESKMSLSWCWATGGQDWGLLSLAAGPGDSHSLCVSPLVGRAETQEVLGQVPVHWW